MRDAAVSRPYSPLAVLRAVPPDLLAAYCTAHAVPLDPDALAPAADARRVMAAHANADAMCRMLDRHFPADVFPRDGLVVTAATVAVSYQAGEKSRALTFEVTARGTPPWRPSRTTGRWWASGCCGRGG